VRNAEYGMQNDQTLRTPHSALRSSRQFQLVIACLILIVLVFAVFAQTIHFSFINYDDDIYVSNNPYVTQGLTRDSFKWAWAADLTHNSPGVDYWQPLSALSRMVDVELYGLNPSGHHLTNLLLHTANAVLLFLFLQGASIPVGISFLAACVFAVHPLQVDAVAWITARKDLLCTFFGFLSLWSYQAFAKGQIPRPKREGRVKDFSAVFYGLSILFFTLSLMAKPALAALPAVFLVLDAWLYGRIEALQLKACPPGDRPLGDRPPGTDLRLEAWSPKLAVWRKLIFEKWPFFALVFLSFLTLATGHSTAVDSAFFYFASAKIPVFYVRYLFHFFYPLDLLIRYPEIDLPLWMTADSLAVIGGVTYFCVRLYRKFPYFLAGWLWFLVMLAPSVSLDFENRYMYVPMIGPTLAILWGLFDWFEKLRVSKAVQAFACAGLVAALGLVSWISAGNWENSYKLFGKTLSVDAKNPRALNNYAVALVELGRFNEAEDAFTKAIWMWPNYAEAHNNLGVTLMRQGKDRVARTHMEIALKIKPDYDKAFNNLSILARRTGDLDAAIRYARQSIQFEPQLLEGHFNLAIALADKGLYDEAIKELNFLLSQNQRDAEALSALGFAYDKKGEFETAVRYHQDAIRLDPDFEEAHKNLGDVYLHMGRMEDALHAYKRAAEISPMYAEAQNNAAVLLNALGNQEEALKRFEMALKSDPDYVEARQNLRLALSKDK